MLGAVLAEQLQCEDSAPQLLVALSDPRLWRRCRPLDVGRVHS